MRPSGLRVLLVASASSLERLAQRVEVHLQPEAAWGGGRGQLVHFLPRLMLPKWQFVFA